MVDLKDRELSRQCEPERARVEPGTDDDDLPNAVRDGSFYELVEEPSANSHPAHKSAR